MTIDENTNDQDPVGLQVIATDGDVSFDFNQVEYELNGGFPFGINKTSGEIFVKLVQGQTLDFDSDTKKYTFIVNAKDSKSTSDNCKTWGMKYLKFNYSLLFRYRSHHTTS